MEPVASTSADMSTYHTLCPICKKRQWWERPPATIGERGSDTINRASAADRKDVIQTTSWPTGTRGLSQEVL